MCTLHAAHTNRVNRALRARIAPPAGSLKQCAGLQGLHDRRSKPSDGEPGPGRRFRACPGPGRTGTLASESDAARELRCTRHRSPSPTGICGVVLLDPTLPCPGSGAGGAERGRIIKEGRRAPGGAPRTTRPSPGATSPPPSGRRELCAGRGRRRRPGRGAGAAGRRGPVAAVRSSGLVFRRGRAIGRAAFRRAGPQAGPGRRPGRAAGRALWAHSSSSLRRARGADSAQPLALDPPQKNGRRFTPEERTAAVRVRHGGEGSITITRAWRCDTGTLVGRHIRVTPGPPASAARDPGPTNGALTGRLAAAAAAVVGSPGTGRRRRRRRARKPGLRGCRGRGGIRVTVTVPVTLRRLAGRPGRGSHQSKQGPGP